MKKYIQIFVALAVVLAVVGVAQGGTAWASGLPEKFDFLANSNKPVQVASEALLVPPPMKISITESGTYNIGGICLMEVDYKGTGLTDDVDAEIPVEDSSQVPFTYFEKLIYPGCHVVHSKDGKVVREADPVDGAWNVCFGANPFMEQKIYYYLDDPQNGVQTWIPIPSYLENGYICSTAPYTGVYMPAGRILQEPGGGPGFTELFPDYEPGGSVQPPPSEISVSQSGTYAVGGVCAIIIHYNLDGLADTVRVKYPTEDTLNVPFPSEQDKLFLPGCHVIHYRDSVVKKEMTREEGDWKICFSNRPDMDMTIYFYRDDLSDITPPWQPLDTTIEGGLACAPLADYSGVYAPAGQ